MWITIGFGLLLLCALVYDWIITPMRWRREYLEDWKKHLAGAFHPTQMLINGNRHHYYLRRVADEWISTSGKRAVRLHHGGSGMVVHELRADGSFSERGPYFVKLRPLIWAPNGRRHIVDVEIGPGEFRTSNPSGGYSRERGVRVIEQNTASYAPLTLQEYAQSRDAERRSRRANGGQAA